MDYSFNSEIAKIYGVNEAVFIHNLYWWIAKNEANGRHYYGGRSWTYNTVDAFAKLFPFWTKRQVEGIIKRLREKGALLVGNYNQSTYDRTQWYALHESVTCIYANGEMDITKRCNPSTQTVTTIPDSKPDINTDSKLPPIPPEGADTQGESLTIETVSGAGKPANHSTTPALFAEFWKAYPKRVGKGSAEKAFKKLKPTRELLDLMLSAVAKQKKSFDWTKDNGQYIPHPSSWLNQRRWEDETEEPKGDSTEWR